MCTYGLLYKVKHRNSITNEHSILDATLLTLKSSAHCSQSLLSKYTLYNKKDTNTDCKMRSGCL